MIKFRTIRHMRQTYKNMQYRIYNSLRKITEHVAKNSKKKCSTNDSLLPT